MSWCLRDKAIANTDLNLEWIVKRGHSSEMTNVRKLPSSRSVWPAPGHMVLQVRVMPHICAQMDLTSVHNLPNLRHIPAEGPALSPWKQRGGVLGSLSCVWPCRSLWQDLSWDGMLFALQVSTSGLAWDLLSYYVASTSETPRCLWLVSVFADAFWVSAT